MSYISSLNILSEDPSIPISEQDVTDELAIWANAQFKFDSTPGTALLDDSLNKPDQELFKVLNELNGFEESHTLMMNSNEHKPQHYSSSTNPLLSIMTNTDKSMMPTSYSAMSSPTTTISDLYSHTHTPTTATTNSINEMLLNNEDSYHDEDMNKEMISLELPMKESKSSTTTKKKEGSPDDDKRRRNTAASARFRLKKKLKEQALQQTVKEMSLRSELLEKRCKELELEAKWLRALLVEKNPSLVTPLSNIST